jgi:hypothetical protein
MGCSPHGMTLVQSGKFTNPSIMKKLHKTSSSSSRIETKSLALDDSGKSKHAHQPAKSIIASNDRLGPDEPLDEANGQEIPGTAVGEKEVLTSDHRVSKIEPDDEHNNENLIEEGLQGYMHDSLTKPRKTT